MQRLLELTREAQAEVGRVMQICNACRYCEGFCAVFPAMARRLEFGAAELNYLANLCHGCGACLHACQYATPHEFAVNVPRAMARVRVRTYEDYAWPPALGALYRRNGLALSLALAAGLALFLVLAAAPAGGLAQVPPAGNFYAVFPHGLLVGMFAPVFGFVVFALSMGVRCFWRDISPGPVSLAATADALRDALHLRYLDGGHGEGCNNADDAFTPWRRRFHHAAFYGFALCFASTSVATLYHYAFGWPAPYVFASVPVLLGTLGGLGLVVGPVGLLALHLTRHPEHDDPAQKTMDLGFIALLLGTGLSGLALLAWRDGAAMAPLLMVHLGFVMALFLTMPYGKFAHGPFRAAALLAWAVERRQAPKVQLGGE